MSHQIISSELFVVLSDEVQELVTGGADFELAGSNFANRLANLQGTTASGPNGSTGSSIGTSSAVNTAAQDFLGLGAPIVPQVAALGAAPILNGQGSPLAGPEGLGGPGGPGGPGGLGGPGGFGG
ncbi:CTB family bacteriocin [Anabaena aphanizomenioides LEGE 00250]|uniref:CTB family bacteriocin n=1 Tax=Sphaerospermopsis aphanizomenoides LEGE 00250 TaxID=2777972 RepID=A0ABR9VGZ4_9CYAN|nr:CTB family bacteriocin [Sphaerospermopsis aphanizomenoides]MBE9237766.1 CTB family bacteriocin [Sphaerospermopsis aphanizomenoides LEGE 00250]